MPLQKHKKVVAIAALALGFAACRPASASNVYSYVTDQNSYTGPVGSTMAVKFYLKEELTDSSTSFITRDGGLFGFGVEAVDNLVSDPYGAKVSSATVNSVDFSGPQYVQITPTRTTYVPPGGFNIGAAIGLPPASGAQLGNTGGGASPSTPSDEIFLATAYFTVGAEASTFSLGAQHNPYRGYGGNTLTVGNSGGYFPDLDLGHYTHSQVSIPDTTGVGASVSTFAIFPSSEIAPLPEPAGVGLLGCGGLLALARRRR